MVWVTDLGKIFPREFKHAVTVAFVKDAGPSNCSAGTESLLKLQAENVMSAINDWCPFVCNYECILDKLQTFS